MNQVNRPEQIDTILDRIDAQFPYEMGVTLEKYISSLETDQQYVDHSNTQARNANNSPIWSHARVEKRAQRRRERAAKKKQSLSIHKVTMNYLCLCQFYKRLEIKKA